MGLPVSSLISQYNAKLITSESYRGASMALAEQIIDPKIRVIVHVDPVFFTDIDVDDKSAVVILMMIINRLGDVVLRERGIGHIGEFADGDIADVVGFHGVLYRVLRRRLFRLLLLADIGDIAI